MKQISKDALHTYARKFLERLECEKIQTADDLERRINQTLEVDEATGEFIEILNRPSRNKTRALVISYVHQHYGIPIDIALNRTLDYTSFTVKTEEELPSYTPFHRDAFQNIMQSKDVHIISIPVIKKELETLQTI